MTNAVSTCVGNETRARGGAHKFIERSSSEPSGGHDVARACDVVSTICDSARRGRARETTLVNGPASAVWRSEGLSLVSLRLAASATPALSAATAKHAERRRAAAGRMMRWEAGAGSGRQADKSRREAISRLWPRDAPPNALPPIYTDAPIRRCQPRICAVPSVRYSKQKLPSSQDSSTSSVARCGLQLASSSVAPRPPRLACAVRPRSPRG